MPPEPVLSRDRAVVLLGLLGVVALAWLYLADMAAGMGSLSDHDGLGVRRWDARYFALMLLMWAVMMAGMMLPSATPMILLFAAAQRRSRIWRYPLVAIAIFTLGYLAVWSAFSVLAAFLQWGLSEAALVSPHMVANSALVGGALLIAAGLYQWTPLKGVCLRNCRSPFHFLMHRWRPGHGGALRMGVEHGGYCVGCCWALMGLLFVGGVMNLVWVAAIAVFVLAEKVVPYGEWAGRISGAAMLGAGLYVMVG